ncbi:MAG: sporulation initiation factor Spo0A C-terminal domain-containing protein [Bacillota bacterium]|nr:sporulation initiation factor Spo0A C-terminal domain-containing protein [Bacillota bacterium]
MSALVNYEVTQILFKMGVKASTKGYGYLREAILMVIEDPDIINAVTKEFYPAIAEKHNDTWLKVERAIRHAIETSWDEITVEWLNDNLMTNFTASKKPCNSEFIATVADSIRVFREVGKNVFASTQNEIQQGLPQETRG